MNLLFTTQGASLNMFEALGNHLSDKIELGRTGYTISNSWYYTEWIKNHPAFEGAGHLLLKEWEITNKRSGMANPALLARYEKELGLEDLFGAIVADRRLLLGPHCTYRQDYRRRFDDRELYRILEESVLAMEKLFDELQPDYVIGYVCTTALEYLASLFAKARNIPYLNLRPSRIGGNYAYYSSTIKEPGPELVVAFNKNMSSLPSKITQAKEVIESARQRSFSRYEGQPVPSAKTAQRLNFKRNILGPTFRLWKAHLKYKNSVAASDNHVPGILTPTLFNGILNPIRARYQDRILRPLYTTSEQLQKIRYAFFPLHTEPEVSLLINCRPLMNQIEIIRMIATSLPVDMNLAVKEHPWMVGKRSISAYRKLLNIPRVKIVPPEMEVPALVAQADLITLPAGTVALDSMFHKKPVLTLGHTSTNLLPDTMVRRCEDLTRMPEIIRELLDTHEHNERALEAYIATILERSDTMNLYTGLLERKGYTEEEIPFEKDVATLGELTLRALKELSIA
ncbi:MAG: hypothetical protein HOC91_09465 [Nitrospinaceae bacterium]|nr:hypothetical protein [Nitrospinaceae bacterium]MBT4430727.1 hypothetical protein [Nitrospinaceae bacterium]MBT5367315.1 hypothetical protein [Nitrospinaceae bacterium]MBT6394907.1 hypothetical protein [Nitrospinaceae bacterium]